MKSARYTTLLLAFALPGMAHAATDGTLGATSTGTFTATAQINPPDQPQVQVFGLEDFVFAPVTRVAGHLAHVTSVTKHFCINNTFPGGGPIAVTISQAGETGAFNLNNGGGKSLPVSITLDSPWLLGSTGSSSFTVNINGVDASCNTAALTSGSGNVSSLTMAPERIAADSATSDGTLQGQFSITVTPG